MNIFVTGTDTGVGKTFFVVEMLRHLGQQGVQAVGMKPVCCGDRGDASTLLAAGAAGVTLDEINPVWLRTPVAPAVAARIEGVDVDLERLLNSYRSLAARFEVVIVEGVGGWMVPLTQQHTTADFASRLSLPVVVVAANRLGCLNHVSLTLHAIRSSGLDVAAVALNEGIGAADSSQKTNAAEIARLSGVMVYSWRTGADFGTGWGAIFNPKVWE